MPEKLITKKEAAMYLGLSERQLQNLVSRGRIPAYRIGGSLVRFKHENLEWFKKASRQTAKKAKSTSQQKPVAFYKEVGFTEKAIDFFYFNDFYIVSSLFIITFIFIIIYI